MFSWFPLCYFPLYHLHIIGCELKTNHIMVKSDLEILTGVSQIIVFVVVIPDTSCYARSHNFVVTRIILSN